MSGLETNLKNRRRRPHHHETETRKKSVSRPLLLIEGNCLPYVKRFRCFPASQENKYGNENVFEQLQHKNTRLHHLIHSLKTSIKS